MIDTINVNGEIFAAAEARVSAMDHGFLFGDSIYETLAAYDGAVFRLDAHLERLGSSADALELALPLDAAGFAERIERTMEAAGEADAAIRLVVTRGVGPMDIDPSRCDAPSVLVYARRRPKPPAAAYAEGVKVSIVTRRRNSRRSLDPNVKSGNYLNSVLALMEARKTGAFEAVMLNAEGAVTECSTSNVFLVLDGRVVTPALSCGLLSGITRRTVLALCGDEGIEVEERVVAPEELRGADEVFITSSIKQVLPVSAVDDSRIGAGSRGPITARLLDAYRRAVEAETGVAPERQ